MKNKKVVICVLIVVIIAVCIGIGISLPSGHEHSFGEWETRTPATCESAAVEARRCECGEEETREGDPATGHHYTASVTAPTCTEKGYTTYTCACGDSYAGDETEALGHTAESISAVSNMEKPMEDMVIRACDLSVTATCGCGERFAVTDGVEMEDTVLVLGENTIAVQYGELSTTVTIEAAELDITLDAIISDDTYVSSSAGSKDNENTGRNELGTNLTSFRTYFRVNISDILNHELFAANEEDAKVRLVLTVTSGSITEDTAFTLKAYTPAAGVTNIDFSELTWNGVKNTDLHWSNGTVLVSGGVGHNVSVDNGCITITLAYGQLKDYIDGNGNILFAFATNTSGLKIGSLENDTESNRPVFQVVLNGEHFHVFDRKSAESQYLISANCGERASYYMSCSCGETGTETFEYGGVIAHSYISLSAESKLAYPMAGTVVKASDLRVTAICKCGRGVVVTDRIELENTTLVPGKNTIAVRYGRLSTTLNIEVEDLGVILAGVVSDDTYVSSGSKDSEYTGRSELGTNVSSFRTYYRVNVSDILSNEMFVADDAKVQLTLAITAGEVTDETTFTLKAYTPAKGVTDVDFSKLTWNSVNNKEGTMGAYSQLHWSNGTELVSSGVCKNGYIIVTLEYSQIADFIDENGNILLAFATNTSGLKVASNENTVHAAPAVHVVLSGEHIHVFDQEVAEEKYLASANYGEKAKYYMSCSCGEKGTETFEYGEVITHSYTSISAESKLENPTAGTVVQVGDLTVTATCGVCGEHFTITDGIQIEGATLTAGKNTVTVRYGEISTTVTIEAAEKSTVLDGTVSDDTYVFASSKDSAYADKTDMGTNSSSYRVYFRVNVSDILKNEQFAANKENAKVQLILTFTSGSVAEDTTFTLKAYAPAVGVTDIAFNKLTWNSVDNKEGSMGAYSQLHWSNGALLAPGVSVNDGKITLTLDYSELADYVDGDGNILLAFATNTSGLKVGSLENETEANRPMIQVVLNPETTTHEHAYGEWETKIPATCNDDEVQVRKCGCGQEETQTVSGSALGHNMVTHYDETHHWTECANEGCDETTEKTAHFGGTATETEKAVCEGCGQPYGGLAHEHSFSEWETETPATCHNAEVEVRKCACGEKETREGDPATGDHNMVNKADDTHHWTECDNEGCDEATEKILHAYVSISAESKLENPMATMVVQTDDLAVTGTCLCGKTVPVTEGITLENATLAFGENTVTVRYGDISTTLTINAAKLDVTLSGTVTDDTYVYSSGKNNAYADRTDMGTKSDSYRVYFRVNVSDILSDARFAANQNDAKVQLILAVTEGNVADTTTFTLKTYDPNGANTNVAFPELTWNSVNDKAGSEGAYSQLNWNKGTELVSAGQGYNVAVENGYITITLTYSQIKDYMDANGNIIFVFATNTSGLKVGSLENGTEASRPAFKVILNQDHFHAFDKEVAASGYLKSEATCTSAAVYYKSCSCGERGTGTFVYGDVAAHTPFEDDGDCTTAVICSVCGETTTAALAHDYSGEWQKDESGHWHACANEGCTVTEEMTAHTPFEDDGDCTTAVVCSVCGETTTAALAHDYSGEWQKDESGHWHACGNEGCTVTDGTVAHSSSSPATETDAEVCQHCGYMIAPALGHTHRFNVQILNEDTKVCDATCTQKATYRYSCSCGEIGTDTFVYGDFAAHTPFEDDGDCTTAVVCSVCGETTTEAFAEHSAVIRFDETQHWTECDREGCDHAADPVAHSGGTATEAEKAVCEGCNQPYGELKQPESTEVTVLGEIVQDTYISSKDTSAKDTSYAGETELFANNSNNYRPLFKFDLSEVLESEAFAENSEDAVVSFTFGVSTGADLLTNDATTYNIYGFLPGDGVSDVDFTAVTWNTNKSDGTYKRLYRNKSNADCVFLKTGAAYADMTGIITVAEVEGNTYVTYTLQYRDIEQFICKEAGDTYGYLVMGFDFNKNIRFASMENDVYAQPAVSVTYTK